MNKLLVIALATALAGCADMPANQGNGTYAQPRDPSQWRALALANGIKDPRSLVPGTELLVPRLR